MKKCLELITPRAFGNHSGCQGAKWCKFSEDPESYKHSDLPSGLNVQGEDLRSAIFDDTISPLLGDEAISFRTAAGVA